MEHSNTSIPVKISNFGKTSLKEMEIGKENELSCKLCGERKTDWRTLKQHIERHITTWDISNHAVKKQEPQAGNPGNLSKKQRKMILTSYIPKTGTVTANTQSNFQQLSEKTKKLCWKCGKQNKTEDHQETACEQLAECNNCGRDNHMTKFCKKILPSKARVLHQGEPSSSDQDNENEDDGPQMTRTPAFEEEKNDANKHKELITHKIKSLNKEIKTLVNEMKKIFKQDGSTNRGRKFQWEQIKQQQ